MMGSATAPAAGGTGGGAPAVAPVPKEDFNFEEALKRFNKQDVLKEAEAEAEQHQASYKKVRRGCCLHATTTVPTTTIRCLPSRLPT